MVVEILAEGFQGPLHCPELGLWPFPLYLTSTGTFPAWETHSEPGYEQRDDGDHGHQFMVLSPAN